MADTVQVTCDCGKRHLVPAEHAGQRFKCKSCGGWVKVLGTPVTGATQIVTDPPLDTRSREMPGEPWYYSFLAGYAKFCMAVGIFQFGICSLLAFNAIAAPDSTPMVVMIIVYSFAAMLAILLMSATVLLAVDAARNLRVIRWRN